MSSYQKIQKALSIVTNAKKRITDEEMRDLLEVFREMNKDELILAHRMLFVNAIKGTDLSMISLMLTSLLRKAGIDANNIPPLGPDKMAEVMGIQPQSVSVGDHEFQIASVKADLGVKDRERVELSVEVVGRYTKRIRYQNRDFEGKVVAALFSRRYGTLHFLASLVLKLSPKDVEEYGMKSDELIISERSLRASPENWAALLRELESVSKEHFNAPFLCVRHFFLSSLAKGDLFLKPKAAVIKKKLMHKKT